MGIYDSRWTARKDSVVGQITTNVIRAGNFAIFLTFSSRAFERIHNKIQDSGWETRRGRKLENEKPKIYWNLLFRFYFTPFYCSRRLCSAISIFFSRLKMKLISYESFYYDSEKSRFAAACSVVLFIIAGAEVGRRPKTQDGLWSSPEWDFVEILWNWPFFLCHSHSHHQLFIIFCPSLFCWLL